MRLFQRRRKDAPAPPLEPDRTELAVAAERNRIAREMHDVVAHSLSVIVIQAEGGRYAAATDPTAAERALNTIAETGRAALADTRRILGLLRNADEAAERAPVPEDESIAELVSSVRSNGLDVSYVKTGIPRELPPGMSVAAYRICQESLTNVIKHTPVGTRVLVSEYWHDSGLRVTITDIPSGNDTNPDGSHGARLEYAGPGNGIVGMRERAELFGGALEAGPTPDGGFKVRADLPYPVDEGWSAPTPVEPDPPEEETQDE